MNNLFFFGQNVQYADRWIFDDGIWSNDTKIIWSNDTKYIWE